MRFRIRPRLMKTSTRWTGTKKQLNVDRINTFTFVDFERMHLRSIGRCRINIHCYCWELKIFCQLERETTSSLPSCRRRTKRPRMAQNNLRPSWEMTCGRRTRCVSRSNRQGRVGTAMFHACHPRVGTSITRMVARGNGRNSGSTPVGGSSECLCESRTAGHRWWKPMRVYISWWAPSFAHQDISKRKKNIKLYNFAPRVSFRDSDQPSAVIACLLSPFPSILDSAPV